MYLFAFYTLAPTIVMILFCSLNSKRSPLICLFIAFIIPTTTLYFITLLNLTIVMTIIVLSLSLCNLFFIAKQLVLKNN